MNYEMKYKSSQLLSSISSLIRGYEKECSVFSNESEFLKCFTDCIYFYAEDLREIYQKSLKEKREV